MKFTHYLVLAAAALSLGSCNSGGSESVAYFTDIVTLDSSTDAGSVMSFRELNDSPVITLTSTKPLNKEQVGKRIVIVYSPVGTIQHGVSGNVNLINAGLTYGAGAAPLDAVVDSLDNWKSGEISFMQAYRSGEYLNLGMILPTNATLEKFRCYIDITTLDNEYPEIHVVYKAKDGYDSASGNFFGSYNISGIWNRPNVKGIKVLYKGYNNGSTIIEKSSSTEPEK